ncbi:hypothetical protein [Streptomyces sp. NPDC054834]
MPETISAVDLLVTLPDEFLPADVIKANDARDAALDALEDFEAEHADALADNWAERAEAADIQAAVAAVSAGKTHADVLKLPSKVDEVRALRPKLTAIQRKLAGDVRVAEAELVRRYNACVAGLLPGAHRRLDDAVRAAEDAYAAYLAARDAAGMAMGQITHIRDRINGGRSDAPFAGAVYRADGLDFISSDSMGQLREAAGTYSAGDFKPNPEVDIIGPSGVVLTLPLDRAEALVTSGSNDIRYVDPGAVEALLAEVNA